MRSRKVTALLAAMMVLSVGTTAFATENWEKSEPGTADVEVTATVSSDFTVTIPKTVALSKEGNGSGTWGATFKTTAEGDIGTAQTLTVAPAVTTFKLTSDAGVESECTVGAGKTAFVRDELNTGTPAEAKHTLSAELTPGTWEGTFAFNVELGATP